MGMGLFLPRLLARGAGAAGGLPQKIGQALAAGSFFSVFFHFPADKAGLTDYIAVLR